MEGIYDAISYPDEFKDNFTVARDDGINLTSFFAVMAALVLLFCVLYYFLICVDSLSQVISSEILPTSNPLLDSLMTTGNFNYNTN